LPVLVRRNDDGLRGRLEARGIRIGRHLCGIGEHVLLTPPLDLPGAENHLAVLAQRLVGQLGGQWLLGAKRDGPHVPDLEHLVARRLRRDPHELRAIVVEREFEAEVAVLVDRVVEFGLLEELLDTRVGSDGPGTDLRGGQLRYERERCDRRGQNEILHEHTRNAG